LYNQYQSIIIVITILIISIILLVNLLRIYSLAGRVMLCVYFLVKQV